MMNTIYLTLSLKEALRRAFADADNFKFEHLANGFFYIQVYENSRSAGVKSRTGETQEQNDLIAEAIIARIREKLAEPKGPLQEIMELLTFAEPQCVDEVGTPITVDVQKFKSFRESFDEQFTDEENEAARLEIQNILANRRWLRDNKKALQTTQQTLKFHELANKFRASGKGDAGLHIAYSVAIGL